MAGGGVPLVRGVIASMGMGLMCGGVIGASVPYLDQQYQGEGVVRPMIVVLGAATVGVIGMAAGAIGGAFILLRRRDNVPGRRLRVEAALLGMVTGIGFELVFAATILTNLKVVAATLVVSALGGSAIGWYGERNRFH